MTQYIKVVIEPGQQKRSDISDWVLSTGEHVWIAEDGVTFDDTAPLGTVLPSDTPPPATYTYAVCTQAEIDELASMAYGGRTESRRLLIQEALIDVIKGMVEIFQVGQTNGVWLNTDFPLELRQKFAEWLTLIAEHEADAQEPPTE